MRWPSSRFTVILLIGAGLPAERSGAAAEKAAKSNEPQSPSFASNVLFKAGDGGYACYRIPALVTTKQGTILAFC